MTSRTAWPLAAAVAGALFSPAVPAGAGPVQPVYQQGVTFDAPVRMSYTDPAQIGGPGEPSIKVDSAGTIYMAGVCCVVRAAPAWYSRDGGKTFRGLPSPAGARENGVGAEGDFTVDDADNLYFSDTWIPSVFFTRWSGHGDVWEYTHDTVTVLPGVDDRPWLAYSNGAIYLYVNHVTHVAVWKSTDGGLTWDEAWTSFGTGQRYFPGMIAADRRTDDVYLFGSCGSVDPSVCASVSHDAGATWTEVPIGEAPRGTLAPFMTSVDVDSAGNVYGVFADANSSGCDVNLAVSSDRGATWRQFRVNPATGCSTFPWVAAGGPGRVAVAWYHNPSKKHQDQAPATSEWRMNAAVITEAASDAPRVTHGALDQVIHRGPLGRYLWDYQQIAVGPDGRFHVAFAEDAQPPCSGTLSPWGALLFYTNKCTTWVAQAGGPRAVEHAADATSVGSLQAAGGAGGLAVGGAVTFGRGAAQPVLTSATAGTGLDITGGTITRPTALSDELVFDLAVRGIPEGLNAPRMSARWPFSVGSKDITLFMQSQPRQFLACVAGGACTRIRGDVDAGGDRFVGRVPLSALGLPETGGAVAPRDQVQVFLGTQALDSAQQGQPFVLPRATVRISVTDAEGREVASADASLSQDLSAFGATIDGLSPGTYTVTATACFGGNCGAATQAGVTVG